MQAQSLFLHQTGDPSGLHQLACQQPKNLRQQQASSLAYFDVLWMSAVLTFAVAFLVLVMKRSATRDQSD
jgi:DHA2 family multidrug resistance protein